MVWNLDTLLDQGFDTIRRNNARAGYDLAFPISLQRRKLKIQCGIAAVVEQRHRDLAWRLAGNRSSPQIDIQYVPQKIGLGFDLARHETSIEDTTADIPLVEERYLGGRIAPANCLFARRRSLKPAIWIASEAQAGSEVLAERIFRLDNSGLDHHLAHRHVNFLQQATHVIKASPTS